ncbi:conserved Plasmodium protein, unknown function [Plasmodium knowlesi strain H]|uniref:Uncharacterized protein n=3 Tax=Plasmodium knowlesi TaxID=5850 RepID=A0A5K1VLH8_PLAKH|nr:conserved Plasmodium protein, unknown function [Plasmodium knowlesi strain H]OTN67929.1 Uncharacterized protein PKNOH_S04346000 [Plasmodium knowlesi]CAA9990227.1 conserved Plasmodium protein, unknown function [Plasmodium knowlesi strain H]SBO26833.1 conserved Plasmodium protein, unknown function [Plasmodium knowlesi strain H]SBO28449.1 conserved Plasmodium protein, unknown function [Plasmodium knowlesi strain H]VVS79701.1 conserved Plasmodium protein, unknown function [Plasmodium knowlesi s|eukprot:XP_002258074.1 hypothetical protein, conserved in Plasmodium species [Plasmodium knowlesi strain H]
MPPNEAMNAPLVELLQKWEAKRINLSNVCLCLHHLKKNILLKWGERRDFLLRSINEEIITKIVDLLDVNQNGSVADNTKDKYFFLSFVTFVFNTENELLRKNCHMAKEVEENYCRVYNQDSGGGKKNKGKKNDEESQKGTQHKSIEDDKKHLLNKQLGNDQVEKAKNQLHHPNNVFEQFDILIKKAIDLEVTSTQGKMNKLLSCKIYVFYVFLKFIFSLTKECPQMSKHYLKRVKNILHVLMSIQLGSLQESEYLVHLANVTLLMIVHTNFPAVKDCEKEFLNFLIMQLNRKKYSLQTIEQILVTYLNKKKNIVLNDQIYQQLQSHSNDNMNLFLKYGKKENLFFFFNLLYLFNSLLHAQVSNSNQNIYFVKPVECVNINVSIKEMLENVQKVLNYLGTVSRDYLANKKVDVFLNQGGAYVYCKDEPSYEEFTIEEILKGKNPQEIFQGEFRNGENNKQLPNIFTYIIDNVFSFFRGLIKEQDAESITMNLNHMVDFLRLFFIHNNESDLFLINFVGTNFSTYCKELLEKCPSALDELVSLIMCLFRVVKILTQSTVQRGGEGKLMNILSRIGDVERGGSYPNRESDQSGKRVFFPEEDIIHRLYNNAVYTLYVFLKNVEMYSNEQIKEKIFIQYEHFLLCTLDNETNDNFDVIFRNSTSLYVTLKVFYILVKLHKFDFENVHNFFFKLIKLEAELPTANQQGASLFYKNGLHSNAALMQKIKTFILANLDLITRATGETKVEKVKRLESLAKSNVLGRADILSLFERPIKGSSPREELQTDLKENHRASQMNEEVSTTKNGAKKNKRALEKTKMKGETNETWEDEHDEDTSSSSISRDEHFEGQKIQRPKKDNAFFSQTGQYNIKKKKKKKIKREEGEGAASSVQPEKAKSSLKKAGHSEWVDVDEGDDDTVNIAGNGDNEDSVQDPAAQGESKKNKKTPQKRLQSGQQDGQDVEQQEEPLKTNRSSHAEDGAANLKELADNVKMVSSSDAMNSLQYMKQSILNDL